MLLGVKCQDTNATQLLSYTTHSFKNTGGILFYCEATQTYGKKCPRLDCPLSSVLDNLKGVRDVKGSDRLSFKLLSSRLVFYSHYDTDYGVIWFSKISPVAPV